MVCRLSHDLFFLECITYWSYLEVMTVFKILGLPVLSPPFPTYVDHLVSTSLGKWTLIVQDLFEHKIMNHSFFTLAGSYRLSLFKQFWFVRNFENYTSPAWLVLWSGLGHCGVSHIGRPWARENLQKSQCSERPRLFIEDLLSHLNKNAKKKKLKIPKMCCIYCWLLLKEPPQDLLYKNVTHSKVCGGMCNFFKLTLRIDNPYIWSSRGLGIANATWTIGLFDGSFKRF